MCFDEYILMSLIKYMLICFIYYTLMCFNEYAQCVSVLTISCPLSSIETSHICKFVKIDAELKGQR